MMRILLPAILAVSCLTTSPSHAELEEQKKACSSINKTKLEAAFKAAKSGLVKAIDSLKSNAVADQNRYLKWFGTGTPNDVANVRKIYETAYLSLSFPPLVMYSANEKIAASNTHGTTLLRLHSS